jgi:hypothetical protein
MANITAEAFNRLRTQILNIVNNKDFNSNPELNINFGGYGQSYEITAAARGAVIGATEHRQLYDAIVAARVHQTGSVPTTLSAIDPQDIIGDDATYKLNQNGDLVIDDALAGYEDLELEITRAKVGLNNGLHALGSRSEYDKLTTTRADVWGNTASSTSIDCEYKVDFGSVDAARRFWNTGGEIRITGQHTSSADAKNVSWIDLMSNFSYYLKARESAGTGALINEGWSGLTNSYQQVGFWSVSNNALYAENYVKVEAKCDQPINTSGNATVVYIRVTCTDADIGDGNDYNPPIPVDEEVKPGTSITLSEYRADTVYIDAPSPAVTFLNGNTL